MVQFWSFHRLILSDTPCVQEENVHYRRPRYGFKKDVLGLE
jgi:hypothetical protein